MTGAAIVIALFLLAGSALERLAGPMQPFLAGAGVTCGLLFLAGALHLPLAPSLGVIVAAAIAVLIAKKQRPVEGGGTDDENAAGSTRPTVQRSFHPSSFRPHPFPLWPSLLALVPAIWLLAVSAVLPLADYDGRAFWLLKAKAIAHERSVDGPFYHQQRSVSPRNEYPLLLPIADALAMTAGGELDDRQTRWLYVSFAIGFALVLRRELAGISSPAAGAWCAAVFLWLPQIVIEPDGGALSAYSDIALGAFAAAAFLELVKGASPLRFGLWTSFAVLTKNEGVPLAICLLAAAVVVFRRRVVIALVPAGTAVATLFLWRSRLQRSDDPDFARMILHLPEHWTRFATALKALLAQTVALNTWGLFWIACIAAAGSLAVQRQWRILFLAAAVMVPMLVLYAGAVAVTDWNFVVLTGNLAPRVLTHLLGPAFALLAIAAARRTP